MKDFEAKWTGVFPDYWGINCYLVYEFCSITRIALTEIL